MAGLILRNVVGPHRVERRIDNMFGPRDGYPQEHPQGGLFRLDFLEFKGIKPRPFKNYQKTKQFYSTVCSQSVQNHLSGGDNQPDTTNQTKTDRVKPPLHHQKPSLHPRNVTDPSSGNVPGTLQILHQKPRNVT